MYLKNRLRWDEIGLFLSGRLFIHSGHRQTDLF